MSSTYLLIILDKHNVDYSPQRSHTHSSITHDIHSQQLRVSLQKTPFVVRFMSGAYLERQILLCFVEISIRRLRISCRSVRGQ